MNELLFSVGDIPDEDSVFYVVQFGSVLVYTEPSTPKEQDVASGGGDDDVKQPEAVARLGPGMYFGELALLTDSPRRASIRGGGRLGDMSTILLGISRSDFDHIIQREPEARAECALRILGKKADLATILIYPETYKLFAEKLRASFSEETALFWRAVHEYELMCFSNRDGEEEGVEEDGSGVDDSEEGEAKLWSEVSLLVAIEDSLEATKEFKKRVDLVMKFGLASSKNHASLLVQLWERKRSANRIIDKHIAVGSPSQVNVKSAMRQRVEAAKEENKFEPEMFKECKDECFKLMSGSDLDAFRDSKPFLVYQSCCCCCCCADFDYLSNQLTSFLFLFFPHKSNCFVYVCSFNNFIACA
jgi:CRP-like cAMP-binding protein